MATEFNNDLLPDDWKVSPLGHCADVLMGQSPAGDTYNANRTGAPLLNGPAEFGRKNPTAVQWTTAPSRMASAGDILYCVRGNTTGRMNIADQRYAIGRGLAAIRGKEPNAETDFVRFLLEFIKPRIYSVAVGGGSTFPNISRSSLLDFEIPLPPVPEQWKIAGVLGVVQRAMEQQERLLALTAELKKALLHQLFTAGLRGEPQKQTDFGPVPESWEVKPLGDFARAKGGFGFPLDRQGKKSGQFPFFKVSDMNLPGNEKLMIESNNWVDADDLVALKAKTYPKDAVVFPKIGATILTNKKRLLTRDSVVDNNVVAIVVDDANRCRPEFLYQWFQTVDLGKLANPGTVPSITSTRLHATLVPLPKPKEQDEMCAAFVALDRKKDLHAAKRAALTALFRTLLHQLMTARIRVHNLDLQSI